jgi:type VI secretion system secreted protein VgrG
MDVPAGTTFGSFAVPAGWQFTAPPAGGTGTITASPTGPANASGGIDFTLVVIVAPGTSPESTLSLTASVSAGPGDANPANDTATATTTVAGVAPADTTPPRLLSLQRFGFHAQPTRLVLTFDEELAAAGAGDAENFRLVAAGRDRRLGTADDVPIALRSVVHDAAARTITLTSRRRLPLHQSYQLTIRGGTSGVTDLAGNGLAGDAVVPFDRTILAGPSVSAQARFRAIAEIVPGGEATSRLVRSARRAKAPRLS